MPSSLDRTRLLVFELRTLLVRMRNDLDPHTERLERIVDRFMTDDDADRPDEAEKIVGPEMATGRSSRDPARPS